MKDHAWIAAHVPHQGAMCLLDRVESWDADHVRCSAKSHRDPSNPLRAHGRLGAACGIEYAAQAMAVHGALCATGDGPVAASKPGMLASARGVDMMVDRLDDVAGDLTVIATRQAADAKAIAYAFEIRDGDRQLIAGRATVLLVDPAASLASAPASAPEPEPAVPPAQSPASLR